MTLKHTILATIFLVGCGWLFSGDLFTSEEQLIRRTYRELLDEATVSKDIPPLERIFVAKRLTRYFSKTVRGIFTQHSNEKHEQQISRKKLENMLLSAYRVTKQIMPKIISERYELTGEDRILHSKLRIYAGRRESGEEFLEEFNLQLSYVRQDDAWIINEVLAERVTR